MKHLLIADRADILIVGDQTESLEILRQCLKNDYIVHAFANSTSLYRYLDEDRPTDLILLDVVMPLLNGLEICRTLRARKSLEDIPIVLMAGQTNRKDEEAGLDAGATDYISSPFSLPVFKARVRHHVQLSRSLRLIQEMNDLLDERVVAEALEIKAKNAELAKTQAATIQAFAALMEMKDSDTGHHIARTQHYVREIARELRSTPEFTSVISDEYIEHLFLSAPLHDIGKVAIPDHVLLKPGKLDAGEWEIMKTHATHGRNAIAQAESILGGSKTFLNYANEIAYCHHERWDGSGYPQGLSGDEIPLSARIMAIGDVYDALISARPYKTPMPHEGAVRMICEGSGTQFDPRIVDAFLAQSPRFKEIAETLSDQ